jgi:lipopolysaccharide transport system permease protein
MNARSVRPGGLSRLSRDLAFARHQSGFWLHLAAQDVKLRYARSFIGPLWLPLSMALQLTAMTALFTGFSGSPVSVVAPWVAIGMITWNFMSTSLNDSTQALIGNKVYLLESETSLFGFVSVVVMRNLLIALHHVILIVILFIWLGREPSIWWGLLLLTVPMLALTMMGLGLILAIAVARYRDLGYLVSSILMLGFFLSPVLWRPQQLVSNEFIATWNPFTHLLAIIREPLLGAPPDPLSWIVAGSVMAGGLAAGLAALAVWRSRLVFWL